jgi:hypothetical protein
MSIVDIATEAAARLNLTRGRDNKWRGRCPECGRLFGDDPVARCARRGGRIIVRSPRTPELQRSPPTRKRKSRRRSRRLTIVRPAAAAPPRRLEQVGLIAGRSADRRRPRRERVCLWVALLTDVAGSARPSHARARNRRE